LSSSINLSPYRKDNSVGGSGYFDHESATWRIAEECFSKNLNWISETQQR
jgi:hypothetical protein